MHCTLQTEDNNSPKVSEAGKDSTSTIHQQENKSTSLEVTKVKYSPIFAKQLALISFFPF